MVQRPLEKTRSLDKGYAGALMSDPRICIPAKELNETNQARQRKELLGDGRSFKPTTPIVVSEIGFGFMAVAPSATTAQTSEAACLAGELLACAMITWMRSLSTSMGRPATVDAVALYDCTVICEKAVLTPLGQQWSPGPNCSQDADLEALRKCKDGRPLCRGKPLHLPFSFVPPPWLTPHAVLHSGFSALRHCAQPPPRPPGPVSSRAASGAASAHFKGRYRRVTIDLPLMAADQPLITSDGLGWPQMASDGRR